MQLPRADVASVWAAIHFSKFGSVNRLDYKIVHISAYSRTLYARTFKQNMKTESKTETERR